MTSKLDWLTGSLRLAKAADVVALVSKWLGPSSASEKGLPWFPDGSWRWADGCVLARDDEGGRALLSVTGKSLNRIGADAWLELLCGLLDLGVHFTRCDTALDIWDRSIVDIDDVTAAARRGQFAYFRKCRVLDGELRKRGNRMERDGCGVDFGRRGGNGGGRMVRWYDKALESDGEYPCVRCEVEWGSANDRAHQVVEALASCRSPEGLAFKLGRLIAGAQDYVDQAERAHAHLDRMERLPWWSRVLERITDRLRLVALTPVRPLQATARWVVNGVAGSLALVKIAMDSAGDDFDAWLRLALEHGEQRIPWDAAGRRSLGVDPRASLPPHLRSRYSPLRPYVSPPLVFDAALWSGPEKTSRVGIPD
jgi:hypothetical protein